MSGAAEFIQYRMNVRNGSFYCGDTEEKGKTIVIQNSAQNDNIKRYTDKYLTSRRIGNTIKDYPYFSDFLGSQILTFIGAKAPETTKKSKSTGNKASSNTPNIDSVLAEDGEDAEIERDEEEIEPVEDEFEEYDDGDYNAEKYFDDGDGDGDIDDGGEPDYS